MSTPIDTFADAYRRITLERAGKIIKDALQQSPALGPTDLAKAMSVADFGTGEDTEQKDKRGAIYNWYDGKGMKPVRFLLAVLAASPEARRVLSGEIGGVVAGAPDDPELAEIVGAILAAWNDVEKRRRIRQALDLAIDLRGESSAATA